MKRWAIMLGAGLVGGTIANQGHVFTGFLVFGVGVAIAWMVG